MFGSGLLIIAIVGLITLSVGGVLYGLLYPMLTSTARTEKRMRSINDQKSVPGRAAGDASQRRRYVQDRLKELEEKQKATAKKKSAPLWMRLQRAGLAWSKTRFYIFSAFCGVVVAVAGLLMGAQLVVVAGMGLVGAVGFPAWFLRFRTRRRERRFIDEFPNAVDVIVRGVKAGLPLGDCLAIIGREAREPVRTEFKRVLESQNMGVPLAQAVSKLHENMPLAEANFFAIVIAIQQQAGGNLSEALSNLSKVLRDRKKLKGKITAMSQEAKASAAIIGSLPVIVMLLVYLTTPGYIVILFQEPIGNVILGASALWMFIGIMVMRKMINFDF